VDEPLIPSEVKRLARECLEAGTFVLSDHAADRLRERGLDVQDVMNVLRGGVPQPGEFVEGTWRYPILTSRMGVVVAFEGPSEVVIVTAWRNK
jgi:hypothetical protein